MKSIKYYNPKTNGYQTSKVLKIENDIVFCLNVKANFEYCESLENLKILAEKNNPNWHNPKIKKPLVILN
jgi:hypothetical protein